MSKEADRAALEAMLANGTAPVTKAATAPMDASLSASFVKLGIDKKRQTVKAKKPSGVKTRNPVTKRNWEAQRRYDEQHGTSNGYDERIEDALAFHRHESGESDMSAEADINPIAEHRSR